MKHLYEVSEAVDQIKKMMKAHPEFTLEELKANKKSDSLFLRIDRPEGEVELDFQLAWMAVLGIVR